MSAAEWYLVWDGCVYVAGANSAVRGYIGATVGVFGRGLVRGGSVAFSLLKFWEKIDG